MSTESISYPSEHDLFNKGNKKGPGREKRKSKSASIHSETADTASIYRRKMRLAEAKKKDDSTSSLLGSNAYDAIIIPGRSMSLSEVGAFNNIWDFVISNNPCSETVKYYNIWAENYEEDMEAIGYRGPVILAEYIEKTLKIQKMAKILDLGCGSGLVGAELIKAGYVHIDGVDMSSELAKVCRTKLCYKRVIVSEITAESSLKSLNLDHQYDLVIMCSSFCPGHIPPLALPAIASFVAPGGFLVYCQQIFSDERFAGTQFAAGPFSTILSDVEKQNGLVQKAKTVVKDYLGALRGQICLMEKK